jgi:hypothetical protein
MAIPVKSATALDGGDSASAPRIRQAKLSSLLVDATSGLLGILDPSAGLVHNTVGSGLI